MSADSDRDGGKARSCSHQFGNQVGFQSPSAQNEQRAAAAADMDGAGGGLLYFCDLVFKSGCSGDGGCGQVIEGRVMRDGIHGGERTDAVRLQRCVWAERVKLSIHGAGGASDCREHQHCVDVRKLFVMFKSFAEAFHDGATPAHQERHVAPEAASDLSECCVVKAELEELVHAAQHGCSIA